MRRLALLLPLLGACATTLRGLVEPGPPLAVRTLDGEAHRLRLGPRAEWLRHLDGHSVEVRGPRALGRITVREWQVLEGRNGLPVWIGVLERRGVQLAMWDHNSGAYYRLGPSAEVALGAHVGSPVLVEGYVDGAHLVEVVHYRVLVAEPAVEAP